MGDGERSGRPATPTVAPARLPVAAGDRPAVVRGLARLAQADVDGLTDRLVARIAAEVGYASGAAPDAVTVQDLWASCHDNIASLLDALAEAPDPSPAVWAAPAATGRRRALQGVQLDAVLRSYRLGGRVVWDGLVERARAEGAQEPDALLEAASEVWDIVDRFSTAVADAYREARTSLVRADEQRRAELLAGLLEGRGAEPGYAAEAAGVLGLPLAGPFVVLAAATPLAAQAPLSVRGLPSAWRASPDGGELGVVALGLRPLTEVLAVVRPLATGAVGVSPPVAGLAELPSAARWAVLARGTVPAEAREVAGLDERIVDALLVASPDLARRLVDRVLGPLLALPADERRLLLDTLRAWWDGGASLSAAASALYCHRNTVLNRLRRISELTGRSLHEPLEQPAWVLAVSALRLLEQEAPGRR